MPFLLVYSPAKFEVISLLVPPVLGCLGILSPQFRPDLIVVPLHRGAVHLQFSGDQGLTGYAGVLAQIGGDSFLLGAYPVWISNTDAEGRVAVGGNATLSNYGVGAGISPLPPPTQIRPL